MTIPGIDHQAPMTVYPTPTLSLYDDKGQRRAFIDSSNVTFENSGGKIGGKLGNEMVTLGGENDSFAILARTTIQVSRAILWLL